MVDSMLAHGTFHHLYMLLNICGLIQVEVLWLFIRCVKLWCCNMPYIDRTVHVSLYVFACVYCTYIWRIKTYEREEEEEKIPTPKYKQIEMRTPVNEYNLHIMLNGLMSYIVVKARRIFPHHHQHRRRSSSSSSIRSYSLSTISSSRWCFTRLPRFSL